MLTTQLGKIEARGNTELGRKHLDEHSHQVTYHNDPEQQITKARARLNIRREIPRVNISHAGNKRWAEKRQQATNDPFLALSAKYIISCTNGTGIATPDFSRGFRSFR